MNTPSDNPFAHSAPCVLKATANELHDLARKTNHMQTLVSALMASVPSDQGGKFYELQDLDHITQSLEGLADFLGHLSADTPDSWVYPHLAAADVVKLEALAARLTGKASGNSPKAANDDDDLDLF